MCEKVTTILLTGQPGVGKTTLVRKICEELKKTHDIGCQGFYTEEVRNSSGSRLGFDVVTLQGKRDILAREHTRDLDLPKGQLLKVGKYAVFVKNFEELAVPLLTIAGQNKHCELLVLDEVGKMELMSNRFTDAVNMLVNDKVPILATIPIQTRTPLATVERLKSASESQIFEITKANRNQMQNKIVESILKMWAVK